MIASNKTLNKCEYSSNSDSSVVNLLSTDDEVYSVASDDDHNALFNPSATLGHSIFEHGSAQKMKKDIMIHRILGPPCGCRRKCREKLDKNIPILIFSTFWNIPSKYQQNCYLLNCIEVAKPNRSYSKKPTIGLESRRTITAYYSVENGNGEFVNVCKTEFMSLHGLQNSYSRINGLVKMKKDGQLLPKVGNHERHLKNVKKEKVKYYQIG